MEYLKSKQHYIDRYDRLTVERCRWAEKAVTGSKVQKHHKKKLDEKESERMTGAFNKLHLYFVQGEMYSKKEGAITKWMSEDEERDRFYENAKAPSDIKCLTCDREMFVSHDHLETNLDKPDRVLFMYDCTLGHTPRRAFYNDGEEWNYKKPLCPKCQTPFEQVDKDTDKQFNTISTCPNCGHVEESKIPKTADKEKEDLDFEKDRARFCNDEEGMKYVEWMNTAKELTKVVEKIEEKEKNKDLYDKVENLRKLTVPQLKQHITESLSDESYTNLVFEQPNIERIVTIGFSIEDPTEQEEYDSRTKLSKFLKETLKETNWRLMSDGIDYRLGVLTGRLRCYEKEEDLVKLMQK